MKQFIYLAIALLFIGCTSANKKASNDAGNMNSEDQVSNLSSKNGPRDPSEQVPVSPEGARFVPNAIDNEGNAKGFRCVSILDEHKNPLSKAGIQVDDIVLAVNERELQTSKEASYFFELVRLNQYYSIKIQRGHRIFTLKKVSFTEEG